MELKRKFKNTNVHVLFLFLVTLSGLVFVSHVSAAT